VSSGRAASLSTAALHTHCPTPATAYIAAAVRPATRPDRRKATAIVLTSQQLRVSLGAEPIPVPEPFAGMLRFHLGNGLTSALPATSAASRCLLACQRLAEGSGA
jgi:hypothetical protein